MNESKDLKRIQDFVDRLKSTNSTNDKIDIISISKSLRKLKLCPSNEPQIQEMKFMQYSYWADNLLIHSKPNNRIVTEPNWSRSGMFGRYLFGYPRYQLSVGSRCEPNRGVFILPNRRGACPLDLY